MNSLVRNGHNHKVDRLEAELATARGEVSEAAAASRRACAHREEAEGRVRRLNDSKLELVREVRTTTVMKCSLVLHLVF